MKKFWSLFFVVLLFSATLAQDQDEPKKEIDLQLRSGGVSRFLAMGSSPFLLDATNMLTNPAYADVYRNFLWGDIGVTNGAWANSSNQHFGGFNFGLNKQMVFGLLIGNNAVAQNSLLNTTFLNGTLINAANGVTGGNLPLLNNNLELLFAMKIGPTGSFGIGISYGSVKNNITPAAGSATDYTGSQMGFNLGLVMAVAPTMTVDVNAALMLMGTSFDNTVAAQKYDNSFTMINFGARLFMKMNKMMDLVPYVNFMTGSGTVEVGGVSTDLNSIMNLGVGVGINYVNGDFLMNGGVGFALNTVTAPAVANVSPELKTSNMVFPAFSFGAEYYLTNWMKARLGFVSTTTSRTTETAATVTTVNEASTTVFGGAGNDTPEITLGVGFEFGKFHLDATVNDDVLRQGFNIIGGGAANTFARVSASMHF